MHKFIIERGRKNKINEFKGGHPNYQKDHSWKWGMVAVAFVQIKAWTNYEVLPDDSNTEGQFFEEVTFFIHTITV